MEPETKSTSTAATGDEPKPKVQPDDDEWFDAWKGYD